ncbi:MAG: hypothetical protein HOM68_17825, partial [Gemmatimonadetes bacterium]|nr:hypothetical protein [Gemmatimonadota bacterium]
MDYFRGKRFLDTLPDWERGRPALGPVEDYLPRVRSLLCRLGDPQEGVRSVIVGGTNGKGTVAGLLASLLQATGLRCGLYTSPHLHSQRERIRVDGQLLSKDDWADGLTRLYDATRGFATEELGEFSRFEALTALAADLFARHEVDIAIYEVGLGGRYDSTNAWDHDLAVLTRISLDHCEILGNSLIEITDEKLPIARPGQPLFTMAAQDRNVLDHMRQHCAKAEIPISVVDRSQKVMPLAASDERPCTFVDNARLSLAVAKYLQPAITARIATDTIDHFSHAGRFEVVRREPVLVLDGAHNPAAAQALAEALLPLGARWCFVVALLRGHDAAGVLAALSKVASRFVLTQVDHPKAMSAEALAAIAPQGIETQVNLSIEEALREAGNTGPVCVTGSLYLIARTREILHLPHEAEGISEDVAQESLICLEAACRRKGLQMQPVSADGNVRRLEGGVRPLLFYRNKHPFNDYVAARLAEDKGYQQEIFEAAHLLVPKALQVFNPYADDRFSRYKTHDNVQQMIDDVDSQLSYPVVIKKPRSSVSQGVYPEVDGAAAGRRLQSLFENAGFLDNLLLIQAFVSGAEYRVLATGGELLLAYGKQSDSEGAVDGDLNPLHHSSGRAVRVDDADLLSRMSDLASRIAQVIDLGFYAIDVIDAADGLTILELNPNPFCYFYNRSNGR